MTPLQIKVWETRNTGENRSPYPVFNVTRLRLRSRVIRYIEREENPGNGGDTLVRLDGTTSYSLVSTHSPVKSKGSTPGSGHFLSPILIVLTDVYVCLRIR